MLMNGILTEERLAMADRVAQATGARVITDTFVSRMHRGAGRAEALRLPYFGEQAADVLAGTAHLILISTQPPITFFAYPDKPNWLTPEGCELHTLLSGMVISMVLLRLCRCCWSAGDAYQGSAPCAARSSCGRLNTETIMFRWLIIFLRTQLSLMKEVPAVREVR